MAPANGSFPASPALISTRELKKPAIQRTFYVPDQKDLAAKLWNYLRPGDVLVTMGAGDIWRTGEEILRLLESRPLPCPRASQAFAVSSPEVC